MSVRVVFTTYKIADMNCVVPKGLKNAWNSIAMSKMASVFATVYFEKMFHRKKSTLDSILIVELCL